MHISYEPDGKHKREYVKLLKVLSLITSESLEVGNSKLRPDYKCFIYIIYIYIKCKYIFIYIYI